MFGSKDYITDSQLAESLEPLLKRLRDVEKANKVLAGRVEALEASLEALRAAEADVAAGAGDGDVAVEANELGGADVGSTCGLPVGDDAVGGSDADAVLFLPAPSPEGFFAEATSEEQIGKSIYELRPEGGGRGTFALLSSPDAMATAMISVSSFVKPVCRIQGNTHRMPDGIVTLSRGEARLKDGVWVVTSKAVVEFK